jgi:hypothetical protein
MMRRAFILEAFVAARSGEEIMLARVGGRLRI